MNSRKISRRFSLAHIAGSLAIAGMTHRMASGTAGPAADASVPTAPGTTSWPSFRGTPDQRGISGSPLSSELQEKWEFPSPDGFVAAAAIVGPHVFAPALEGCVYCLDRLTGAEVWKYRSIDDPNPKTFAPGFKAAPLVTEQCVYVGDEDGVLHAIDRSTGQRRWKFVTDAEIAGCVAEFRGRLLLASHDSFLYCLNTDGTEIWKFQTNDRINCSPAVAEEHTFLAGCDEHLRVIELETGTEVRDVPLGSFLVASPAIAGDQLYVGTHTGEVVAVNWKSGDVTWRYQGKRSMPYHASAAVTDSLVLVGSHDKHLHAINRTTGAAVWTFATKARIESSAVVVGDRVFLGSGDGNLYGLAVETGEQIWKFNAGRAVNAGLAVGEGVLIAGEEGQNGRLRCFA